MKNMFAVLAATAAVGLATSVYAADESTDTNSTVDYKKNGGYETTSKSSETNADGTDKSTETNVNVDVDSNGHTTKTVKSKSVTDPKGLWNKKTDVSESRIEEKDNGGYKQTTIRKHTDRDGTDTYYKTVTDVTVDNDGNVTSTATSEKITKPQGWFNKSKSTSKTKTVNGTVVEHSEQSN